MGGIDLLSQAGRYGIRPALQVQRVVRYTSEGFLALFRCFHREISIEDCQDRLRSLARADPTFIHHVDPSGRNYVQVRAMPGLKVHFQVIANTITGSMRPIPTPDNLSPIPDLVG